MSATNQLSTALADRYAIERLIGEGGMATVYLARDVRHNRPVALKVLRPDLGAVVGVERFLAEIQVTANLQHPNLLPLFDSGTAGELLFYVMPYVQGESLRARLDREKQLPVDEAIRLATAIGGALDYAHRQGVIHRDLKPENVLLQEGQPLVADFGIALAVSNAGGTRITQTGLSLGTPHYMSPEQATGDRVIDGRTDIYSLGALTYEMLTGEPPHVGSTSQAIIARVLTERPRPIRVSRPSVPEHAEAAVERALEKLPADRWATAREYTEALSGARPLTRSATSSTASVPSGLPSAAAPSVRRGARRASAREIAAWALAALGLAVSVWAITRPARTLPMTRLSVDLPDSVVLAGGAILSQPSVALSPDGKTMAFVGTRRLRASLYVRRMNEPEAREIAGTEGAAHPAFSPDGSWIAFRMMDGRLLKVAVAGGTPQHVTDTASAVSWGDDNVIYFSRPPRELWSIGADGSNARLIVAADTTAGSGALNQIDVLPGAKLALVRVLGAGGPGNIRLVDLSDGRLLEWRLAGQSPRYVAPGFLLYESDAGVLSAVPFSPRKRDVTGTPVRIAEGLERLINGGLDYGVGGNGTIVFRWSVGGSLEPSRLALLERGGRTRMLLQQPGQRYDQPRVSPDGKRVVVRVGGAYFDRGDLWLLDLTSGAFDRLTSGNKNYRASWSRDGKRIYFFNGSPPDAIVIAKPWDGSGADSVVLRRPGIAEFAEGPPGGWSALRTYGARDIMIVPTDSISTAQPRPFVTGRANETDIALSPSGRILAYVSDETGAQEVYLRPVPGPGPRVRVSVAGGITPSWSRDGRSLYFISGTHLMSASITDGPELAVTRRDSVVHATIVSEGTNYAVMTDGSGFIAALGSPARPVNPFRLGVISNWQSLFSKE